MRLIIPHNDYLDMLSHGGNPLVENLVRFAKQFVQSGGQVIVQSEYTNAPPEIIRVLSTLPEVEAWEREIQRGTSESA